MMRYDADGQTYCSYHELRAGDVVDGWEYQGGFYYRGSTPTAHVVKKVAYDANVPFAKVQIEWEADKGYPRAYNEACLFRLVARGHSKAVMDHPDLSKWPHRCPSCGDRAYVGFTTVEHVEGGLCRIGTRAK